MSPSVAVSALIIAGGAGSRLGGDKATLCRAEGTPLLLDIARTLAALATEIIVVAGSPARCAGLETLLAPRSPAPLYWQPDDAAFPTCGPLGGLYSGLQAARHDLVVAVGCDMPFLAPKLLQVMVERTAQGENDILLPVIAGYPQPLHAVYRRAPSLSCAERHLRSGRCSLRSLCADPALRVTALTEDEALALDPSGRSWQGVNTPPEMIAAGLHLGL